MGLKVLQIRRIFSEKLSKPGGNAYTTGNIKASRMSTRAKSKKQGRARVMHRNLLILRDNKDKRPFSRAFIPVPDSISIIRRPAGKNEPARHLLTSRRKCIIDVARVNCVFLERYVNLYRQRTVKKPVSCTGIGLHNGRLVKLTIRPAPFDHGIVFERVDIPGRPRIRADSNFIDDADHATSLGAGGVRVGTVEHLLAAFYGLGIDNALVEISDEEVPIMDGSSAPFIFLLKNAGIRVLPRSKKFYVVTEKFSVSDGDRRIEVKPSSNMKMSFTIDFAHPLIERQNYQFEFSAGVFEREISRARTFGFLHEVEYLKKRGLARGGSLNNAVVVGRFRVLNDDGLRFPDEFVRHKILDQLGDVSLLGGPLLAHIKSHKSGHALNHAMVRKLAENPELVKVVRYDEDFETGRIHDALPAWSLPKWAAT